MIKQLTDEEILEIAFNMNPAAFEYYFQYLPTQCSILGVVEIDISLARLTRHPIVLDGKTYAVLGQTPNFIFAYFYRCDRIFIDRCRIEYLSKYNGRAYASPIGREIVNLYWEWDDGK